MKESAIERFFVEGLTSLGGVAYKMRFIGASGAPDRLVFIPTDGGFERIWIEFKSSQGDTTMVQERVHLRLRSMGERVVVVSSIEQCCELLPALNALKIKHTRKLP